ncbi:hypothetical protein [Sphingobium sp.]|uniref:hypothetical protein n=1 Tax=Sphingobium sp. TaxID=1912891 RepID=UPI002629F4F8|nr:hypothetical protein [Sphingobium sp.]
MTPVMLARLQAASDYVMAETSKKTPPRDIITGLVANHRAFYRRGDPNTLRVAGITATCTTSEDKGLLAYWQRNATVRIVTEASNG